MFGQILGWTASLNVILALAPCTIPIAIPIGGLYFCYRAVRWHQAEQKRQAKARRSAAGGGGGSGGRGGGRRGRGGP
ncbi:MAG: hypothetical protein Q8P30_04630 [Candidatus Uhrbacteria bacterium]|nr:hypothetical protein [Candidatus Uhrbacteria bacterium]